MHAYAGPSARLVGAQACMADEESLRGVAACAVARENNHRSRRPTSSGSVEASRTVAGRSVGRVLVMSRVQVAASSQLTFHSIMLEVIGRRRRLVWSEPSGSRSSGSSARSTSWSGWTPPIKLTSISNWLESFRLVRDTLSTSSFSSFNSRFYGTWSYRLVKCSSSWHQSPITVWRRAINVTVLMMNN